MIKRKRCRYWIYKTPNDEGGYGECHRYAPREEGPYMFPRLNGDDCCGEAVYDAKKDSHAGGEGE